MDTQYYMIGTDGYPIISAVSLDGFTEYVVGQEPADLANALPKIQEELIIEANSVLWNEVDKQWNALTVTTTAGHTFAANKEAMRYIDFKANNMGDTAIFLWVEDWGTFETNIVELKEALNLAADAHQNLIQTIFGA